MGFGSQLRLETDIFASISLEYTVFKNLVTEDGEGNYLVAENGDNFVFTDDENLFDPVIAYWDNNKLVWVELRSNGSWT